MNKTRKKLNQEILSVRDFKDGVGGVIGEFTPMTKESGEPVLGSFGQTLGTIMLGENKYWCDGGLRGTLKLAKVKPGMNVWIQHTGEKEIELEDGRKGFVQTYDVFDNS